MTSRTITVATDTDLVLLRMRVREMAISLGMNLADQARISLAASASAKAVGLGITSSGRVTFGDWSEGGRAGLRAVCTFFNGQHPLAPGALGDVRWMVDVMSLERLPSGEYQLTLVKWRA